MYLDFEVLLVLATIVMGVTVGFAALRRRRLRRAGQALPEKDGFWVDLCRSLFPVILIVLVVRSFVAEPFRIPSGSMIPTLLAGDFILVNKASYGFRLPITNDRVAGGGIPERGELAVFKYPMQPSQDFIKRIVALPGDHVLYEDGVLYINGDEVEQADAGVFTGPEAPSGQLLTENLGDREYTILRHPRSTGCRDYASGPGGYRVPEGHYFAIGDNRDRSSDSRCWGPVSDEALVGRAFLIWMSWNGHENRVNWDRIGTRIN